MSSRPTSWVTRALSGRELTRFVLLFSCISLAGALDTLACSKTPITESGDDDDDDDAGLAPDSAFYGPFVEAPRTDALINDGWVFHRADAKGAQVAAFDDSTWTPVALPHTWNAQDGQDGPDTPYYRGYGWYRRHYTLPADLRNRKLYLQFDGASMVADIFVNGALIGSHKGGFATFRIDVTGAIAQEGDNVIAVRVNNAAAVDDNNVILPKSPTANVPPLSADFTFFGGLYRGVHLLATSALAIDPMDFASPGVYIKQANVTAASADLAITVKLANGGSDPQTATVRATIVDATKATIQTLSGTQSVDANGNAAVVLTGTMPSPHLWNGRIDPYLYSVQVDLLDGDQITDTVTQPMGLRDLRLDPKTGFSLNGAYLDLHGVDKHQDHKDKGWAITDSDTDADFATLSELGVTAVRLAHYQHAQHTYDVTDALGIVVWAETPVVNSINPSPEFAANAEQQLTELIRQNYNHPSIAFWSVGNETLLRSGASPNALIGHLADVAAAEDEARLSAYAANAADQENAVNWHGKAHGFNEYQGWYFGHVADFAIWADGIHAAHPNEPVGLTEFGAGASITQHTVDAGSRDLGTDHTGAAHTEEYQAYYHEGYWQALQTRPFVFGKFIWNAFDFASDGRSEGNTPGLNDKGLVTFDRQTKKDAFYWYKANWSNEPFVYITSRRFTALPKSGTTLKVYSNVDSVELSLNGTSLGAQTSTNHIFTWTGIVWPTGACKVDASGGDAGAVTDSVTWTN